ncbi:MAG: phosphate acyltransferase PlsX [Brumimicrobium sp.]
MKLGLDINSGDFAPETNVLGAILALEELPEDVELVLIGKESDIQPILSKKNCTSKQISIVNAVDTIGMEEHPTRALRQKPNSSISKGFELLAKKQIDSFSSTGNTGAMLVGAMYVAHAIPGVIRPCITSVLPILNGGDSILLDVGTNADCKPDVLYQFAILGSLFATHVKGIDNPKVGLLNIGEEEGKGNLLTQSTYKLMKGTDDFNFIGNVESRDLFNGKADVVVCDGFTGNIILKEAEALYSITKKLGFNDPYFERFNYENYGGTPILGVNSDVIIGHGISNDIAIKNMMKLAYHVAESKLTKKIKEAFKQ